MRAKKSEVARAYIFFKNIINRKMTSQSNESVILNNLVNRYKTHNSFVEFGFSGWEFNCIGLARDLSWGGLLVDGDNYNIKISQQVFHEKIIAKNLWIDLETIEYIESYLHDNKIGVLSVDVDGNDYWFLERLIPSRPSIIISEFNVSFDRKMISVPYNRKFDRFKMHSSGEYYGASLVAIDHLCRLNGYSLVEISSNGVNAFFVRNDLINNISDVKLASEIELAKFYPDGTRAPTCMFWESIKNLPYVDVASPGSSSESKGSIIF